MISVDDLEKLAQSLGDAETPDETSVRCAISRIYYSAFHRCRTAADVWCGPLAPNEGANQGEHGKLYLRMQEHSRHQVLDRALREAAEEAKKLRGLRTTADYHLNEAVPQREFARSKYMLTTVKKHLARVQELADTKLKLPQ